MRKLTDKQKAIHDKHNGIVQLYSSGNYTAEYIARLYTISVRQVQRIAKKHGVVRTIAESNKLMARHKRYHTVPKELRVKREWITNKKRYAIIQAHPYCTVCGMRPGDGIRLEVDHIDEDATNNNASNLQVLCGSCNLGKSHTARFGASPVT